MASLLFSQPIPASAQGVSRDPFKYERADTLDATSVRLDVTDPDKDKLDPKYTHGYDFQVAYRVSTGDLQVDDVLFVLAEAQVTSTLPAMTGIGSFIALGTKDEKPLALYNSKHHICLPSSTDIINDTKNETKSARHLSFTRVGSIKIDQKLVIMNTIFFLIYAVSDYDFKKHNVPRPTVLVESSAGQLCMARIRPGRP